MIRKEELLPSLFLHRNGRVFNLATFNNFVVVKRIRNIETETEVPLPVTRKSLEVGPETGLIKSIFGIKKKHFYQNLSMETEKETTEETLYWVDGLYGSHFDNEGQLRSAQIPLFCYPKIEDAQRQLLRICKTIDMTMIPRVCPSCYGSDRDESEVPEGGVRVEEDGVVLVDLT